MGDAAESEMAKPDAKTVVLKVFVVTGRSFMTFCNREKAYTPVYDPSRDTLHTTSFLPRTVNDRLRFISALLRERNQSFVPRDIQS